MTIQKAISILDWWIDQKKRGMEKLKKEWNYSDDTHGIAKILLDADTTIIANLDLIRSELVPNCKHPKKMHYTCQGQKYCMTCNMDL